MGDADVARIGDSIRTRLDKASAETEIRAQTLDKQMDDILNKGELDAQLAARSGQPWVVGEQSGVMRWLQVEGAGLKVT